MAGFAEIPGVDRRQWPLQKPMHGRLTGFLLAVLFLGLASGIEAYVLAAFLNPHGKALPNLLYGGAALLASVLCLALLLATVHLGLGLLLPRVELRSPTLTGRPGQRLTIAWCFLCPPARIRNLEISLEGYEERRKGFGKNDPWKRTTLFKRELLNCGVPAAMGRGEIDVDIPPQARATRVEKAYRMRWVINLLADVRFLPDLKEIHEITVLPDA